MLSCTSLTMRPYFVVVLITALLALARAGCSNITHLGCYKDIEDPRLLPLLMQDLSTNNSPIRCANLCRVEGYSYSGVEYGKQCFCGNNKPDDHLAVAESECDMRCSGNQDSLCGGFWRLQVYHTGLVNRGCSNITYLGCYKDSEDPRLLPLPMKELSTNNSPIRCANFCRVEGYSYSGVEDSNQCFCGNHKPKDYLAVAESECDMRCSGNQDSLCGGFWRLQLYDTGLVNSCSNITHLGCYKDSEDPRLLPLPMKELSKNNSPIRCANLCRVEGYSYSGVEYGKQCYCGNHKPDDHLAVAESECDMRCSGNQDSFCGGFWRLQLYHTGLVNMSETRPDPSHGIIGQ